MKHPRKRFTEESPVPAGLVEKVGIGIPLSDLNKVKVPKGYGPLLRVDDGKGRNVLVKGFIYQISPKRKVAIPEPDLTLIYFNTAYLNWKYMRDHKASLLDALAQDVVKESVIFSLFSWFGASASCINNLWNALETSINKNFKENSVYKRHGKDDDLWTGEKIFFVPTKERLRYALPQIVGFDIRNEKIDPFDQIGHLNDLRDKFTHPKPRKGQSLHDYLYKEALNFPYERAFEAVKLFINFYAQKPLIEDCDCGKDF